MSGSVEKKVARFIKIIQNDDEFVLQSDAQYLKFKTIKFKPAYCMISNSGKNVFTG